MGEMNILNKSGDTKQIWNPDKPEEVEAAKAVFDKLTAKGYIAFKVDKEGNASTKMKTFDPKAGKIILIPLVQGG